MITARLIHAIVVLTLLPLLLLRGRTLRRYVSLDLSTYALAAIVWPHAHGVDAYLAATAFVAAKIAIFCVFVAGGRELRWSANRAAIAALSVYSLLIPAMQRTPIDGDEPYYLLVTESLIRDRDFDLTNQYAALERSATGRLDLAPQPGDPTGPNGEQFSRHEPLLSILLIPGYLAGGLPGALATMVLFAALLVRSTLRLLEDEGIDDATARLVYPLFAFGPPVVFYAARLWPEVPAAFFFVEALRGVRSRRAQRWVPALLMLAMLKLRFVLVAALLVARAVVRSPRHAAVAAAIVGVPLLVVWFVTGSATNVHSIRDLVAPSFGGPLHGSFGLMLDGAAGIAFQAPFYLVALFGLARWREMPPAFRLGCFSAVLYLALLVPRSEWHGGWSPPLRYIVFLMPVLALGAAALVARRRAAGSLLLGLAALWTTGLVIHGVAHPWRLFHIANGENVAGEALSRVHQSDFSRLFPSFIRVNDAAILASVILVAALIAFGLVRRVRVPAPVVVAIAATVLASGFVRGREAGRIVHLEDVHVLKQGGELFPHEYTVARFAYRGGWIVHEGDSVTFRGRPGRATLHYATGIPSLLQIGSRTYDVAPTPGGYGVLPVEFDAPGRIELRCIRGSVNLDRLVME